MGCEGGRSQRWHYDIQIRVDDSRRQEINSPWICRVQVPASRDGQKADWPARGQ